MVDGVLGERQPPAPTGDWRCDLRTIAHEQRAMALRHPWLAVVPTTRPVLGPNGLAWLEATYATVGSLPLDPDDTLARVGTLLTFVRGHVADELAEREAARRSGMDRAAWMDAQERYGELIFNSGRYPSLSRLMLQAESPHAADRFDRMFSDGVEHILAGIARDLPG
jgi:hypothetical protein